MSEPTRYRVANNQAQLTLGGGILAVDPAGPLVDYADYARLQAEVERLAREQRLKAIPVEAQLLDRIKELKAEVELLSAADSYLQNANEYAYEKRCDELEAEVERLRKAGDDMASSIQFNEEMEKDYDGPTIVHPSVERWNKAKEGKQS